ncbi:hypothetical protein EYF80_007010 [Liparis tanakae]|uniref:Uncharacterized protein n=1 Tax=Liparis tanakae TaxID=230148 RepID=A0A4Z2IXQ3_9TELE|nr:hypothetical protein EYF80_007010 [Liparis tanakae]
MLKRKRKKKKRVLTKKEKKRRTKVLMKKKRKKKRRRMNQLRNYGEFLKEKCADAPAAGGGGVRSDVSAFAHTRASSGSGSPEIAPLFSELAARGTMQMI